jgi:hypothetical protein
LNGNGDWSCHIHAGKVSDKVQRDGCNHHRYIPILLAKTAKPMDVDGDAVVYQMADGQQFTNGDPNVNPKHLASTEIYAAKDKAALVHEDVIKIRIELDGRIV